jgi:hypothetical protein
VGHWDIERAGQTDRPQQRSVAKVSGLAKTGKNNISLPSPVKPFSTVFIVGLYSNKPFQILANGPGGNPA